MAGSTRKRVLVKCPHCSVSLRQDRLESHIDQLHLMAGALMKYESIDGKQIDQIMEGREPDPPEGWNDIEPETKKGDSDGRESRPPIGGPAEQV